MIQIAEKCQIQYAWVIFYDMPYYSDAEYFMLSRCLFSQQLRIFVLQKTRLT